MLPRPAAFAAQPISAQNSHDLDTILGHYSADVKVTSPTVRLAPGGSASALCGRPQVRKCRTAAAARAPDLHFALLHTAVAEQTIVMCYRAVMGKIAVEAMRLDGAVRVSEVVLHCGSGRAVQWQAPTRVAPPTRPHLGVSSNRLSSAKRQPEAETRQSLHRFGRGNGEIRLQCVDAQCETSGCQAVGRHVSSTSHISPRTSSRADCRSQSADISSS